MAQSAAMLDFFVLEASDYLERLDALAQARADSAPTGDEFVRLARAFRGSALMANQQVMARAAQGLEAIARAVRDGRVAWDERVRSEVVRAVDDCQILLRRVRAPEAGDDQRAEGIGAGLERLAGRQTAPAARGTADGLDAGGRAFVAREAAAIASTLDRVARSLERDPQSRDALGSLAGAMSQLRGVAILNDLPPLADVLAAVDGAAKLAHGIGGPVPQRVADVFDAAAKAVARAAREVVESGRPSPASGEARALGAALQRTFAMAADAVPIELLGPPDAGPNVVAHGTAPTGGTPPSRLELVSQGEFLAAATTELRRADDDVVLDLRLFVIGAKLTPLIQTNGSALGRALAAFAEAGWWAIGTGSAAAEPEQFAEVVSDAAATLRSAEASDDAQLARSLHTHAARLLQRVPYPVPAERPRATRPARGVFAAPPLRMPTAPAPATAPPRPPAASSPVAGAAAGAAGLAASWASYEGLVANRGLAHAGLAELLGLAAPDEADVVPIEDLAPGAPAAAAAAFPGDEADVVPIEDLLYDGEGARWRLRAVRVELDAALATSGTDPKIRNLLGEVFDLLDVGLAATR